MPGTIEVGSRLAGAQDGPVRRGAAVRINDAAARPPTVKAVAIDPPKHLLTELS